MGKRITVYLLQPTDRPHWKAEWVEPGTKVCRSRTTGTANPDEAEVFRADLEYELNNGLAAKMQAVPWDTFRDRYLTEGIPDCKEGTQIKVTGIYRQFAAQAKPLSLASVDAPMIARYGGHLRKLGRVPATVACHFAHIHAGLAWAKGQGLIATVPHIDMPRIPKRRRWRTITAAQLPAVLAAMPTRPWRLLGEIGWYTGMRRTEMLLLQWSEDDIRPWIDLVRARVYVPGETGKSGRDDWIPIHPELAAILAPMARKEGRVLAGVPKNAPWVSKRFRQLCAGAGITLTLHDLRRSFGTRYAPIVPAQVLQRLMRHANIRTTMEFYADLDGALDEAIAKG